jgi:ArsR family transcriptional regulator, arsenate/arsenite/antimonite-responsive transcriptional repressor
MKIKKIKALTLERSVDLHKALADEARLRILAIMLKYGEICISDLELLLDYTQTKTSRHVSYLKNAGILTLLKYEKWIYYNIKEEYKDFILPVIEAIEQNEIILKDSQTYRTFYTNNTLATRHLHNIQKRYNLPEY